MEFVVELARSNVKVDVPSANEVGDSPAGMHKKHSTARWYRTGTDASKQAGKGLSGVGRVQQDPFHLCDQLDR